MNQTLLIRGITRESFKKAALFLGMYKKTYGEKAFDKRDRFPERVQHGEEQESKEELQPTAGESWAPRKVSGATRGGYLTQDDIL
jgi:hypothetical protein